jgi:hypothetical protein
MKQQREIGRKLLLFIIFLLEGRAGEVWVHSKLSLIKSKFISYLQFFSLCSTLLLPFTSLCLSIIVTVYVIQSYTWQCTGGILSVQETRRRICYKVVWRSYKRVPRESPAFYLTGDNIRNWT